MPTMRMSLKTVARPEGFEPPTLCLEALGREILSLAGIAACGQNQSKIRP
jgi:hypothetical protein